MRADRRLLGWGLFFILLGAVPLATKAGVIDPAIVGRWLSLWPLLLIGWGLGLLLRRTRLALVGGTVSAITFGLMGGGALATGFSGVPTASGCASGPAGTAFETRQGSLTAAARVNIEFNCGTLAVDTSERGTWTVAGTDRNGRAPTIDASGDLLSISTATSVGAFDAGGHPAWSVTLPKSPALALDLTFNAGDGSLRLDGASLSQVSFTLNAGSLALVAAGAELLGDVNGTVNLGSARISLPAGGRAVDLSLNAGSLKVCLPIGAPVRVQWSGALGSNNLAAAGLVKGDDNTWTSSTINILAPFTELRVRANAGSFEVKFGGPCDA